MSGQDDQEPAARMAAAMELADRRHARQVDRYGKPVIGHLREVAALARSVGTDWLARPGRVRRDCSPDELFAAGCLHACLEDTNATYEEVARAAGTRVAAWVAQVSRDKRRPWSEGRTAYERQLSRASIAARSVKLADVLSNLRGLTGAQDAARIASYLDHVDTVLVLIRRGLEGSSHLREAEGLARSWRQRLS